MTEKIIYHPIEAEPLSTWWQRALEFEKTQRGQELQRLSEFFTHVAVQGLQPLSGLSEKYLVTSPNCQGLNVRDGRLAVTHSLRGCCHYRLGINLSWLRDLKTFINTGIHGGNMPLRTLQRAFDAMAMVTKVVPHDDVRSYFAQLYNIFSFALEPLPFPSLYKERLIAIRNKHRIEVEIVPQPSASLRLNDKAERKRFGITGPLIIVWPSQTIVRIKAESESKSEEIPVSTGETLDEEEKKWEEYESDEGEI